MPDLKAFAQLTRFPNVFTAASNILGAYLLTHANLDDGAVWGALVASSCCLYMAGMVLNDVNDVEQDSDERPFRPIPSGRITLAGARTLGWSLLAAGVLFAAATSFQLQKPAPAIIGVLLAVCIWLYDVVLKRTPVAPVVMGLCRFLNVLLGFSPVVLGTFDLHPMFWVIAAGVGVYTVGLTWFARGEAREGASRWRLLAALLVLLAGVALLASFPKWQNALLPDEAYPIKALQMGLAWFALWGVFGLITVRRAATALAVPEPVYIQATVKQAIFALVIFDAAICVAARGPIPYALVILVLLIPMNLLGRWVYST